MTLRIAEVNSTNEFLPASGSDSERVIAGLRYARQNGTKSGKPVGRPPIIIDGERVVHLRDTEKLSWPEIARRLHSSSGTVRRVYKKAIESSRAPQN